MSVAGVAHPVERHLAKVEVASSSLVTRSINAVSERKRRFSFIGRLRDGKPVPYDPIITKTGAVAKCNSPK